MVVVCMSYNHNTPAQYSNLPPTPLSRLCLTLMHIAIDIQILYLDSKIHIVKDKGKKRSLKVGHEQRRYTNRPN